MYRVGKTGVVTGDASNPHQRKSALAGMETITKNGWCGWIEHHTSKKILCRNVAEIAHQQAIYSKRVIVAPFSLPYCKVKRL
jgi:hypothetical protein